MILDKTSKNTSVLLMHFYPRIVETILVLFYCCLVCLMVQWKHIIVNFMKFYMTITLPTLLIVQLHNLQIITIIISFEQVWWPDHDTVSYVNKSNTMWIKTFCSFIQIIWFICSIIIINLCNDISLSSRSKEHIPHKEWVPPRLSSPRSAELLLRTMKNVHHIQQIMQTVLCLRFYLQWILQKACKPAITAFAE